VCVLTGRSFAWWKDSQTENRRHVSPSGALRKASVETVGSCARISRHYARTRVLVRLRRSRQLNHWSLSFESVYSLWCSVALLLHRKRDANSLFGDAPSPKRAGMVTVWRDDDTVQPRGRGAEHN